MSDRRQDVQRLVDARARIRQALDKEHIVEAGKILCKEFKDLLGMQSFWQGARDAAQSAQQHRADAEALLSEIPKLVEEEGRIFNELAVDRSKWGPVLADVFAGYRLSLQPGDDLSLDALQML